MGDAISVGVTSGGGYGREGGVNKTNSTQFADQHRMFVLPFLKLKHLHGKQRETLHMYVTVIQPLKYKGHCMKSMSFTILGT